MSHIIKTQFKNNLGHFAMKSNLFSQDSFYTWYCAMADVKSELSFQEECQAIMHLFLAEF